MCWRNEYLENLGPARIVSSLLHTMKVIRTALPTLEIRINIIISLYLKIIFNRQDTMAERSKAID